MGILDREQREIRAKVVPNVKRETLQTEVLNNVKYGTQVYTDNALRPTICCTGATSMSLLTMRSGTFLAGSAPTALENFWSLFKRNLRGTYVSVEPFHLVSLP